MEFGESVFEKFILDLDEEDYLSKISKRINVTISHLSNVSSLLKKKGIIENSPNQKSKRYNLIRLTKKGEKIRLNLIKIRDILEND